MTVPDASQGSADVYLVNAQQCSAGTGPGYASLPWDEAKALVDAGYAIYGTLPLVGAEGWSGPVSQP